MSLVYRIGFWLFWLLLSRTCHLVPPLPTSAPLHSALKEPVTDKYFIDSKSTIQIWILLKITSVCCITDTSVDRTPQWLFYIFCATIFVSYSPFGELTSNWMHSWNSWLDVFWRRVVIFSLDTRVTVMTRVSLGCSRLTQNLVLAPASRTAGMATMYCLQSGTYTHTVDISLDLTWRTCQLRRLCSNTALFKLI